MTTVQLTTSDGHVLAADLALPPAGAHPIGAVVLCHPHPQYGGNRFNTVVSAVYAALPPAGYATLRFDFRHEFAEGIGERLDVVAALDRLDAVDEVSGVARVVVGYSFGAAVALGTDDHRIAAVAAVAPPLAVAPVAAPRVPALVLVPRHDQFSPPSLIEPIVATWPHASLQVIEAADHFLAGHTRDVADRVLAWLATVR